MKLPEEEEASGAADWLVTYSDMITLVLTFFVLLYAISSVDQGKFEMMMGGLSPGGISEEQFMAIQEKYNMVETTEAPDENAGTPEIPDATEEEKPNESTEDNLGELYERMSAWIFQNELEEHLFLNEGEGENGDNLLLTLTSDVWFDSGSAELTDKLKEIGAVLGELLRDTQNEGNPFEVIVSGHTDNVPHNTPPYDDNWGLSFARAGNFMRLLITESGLSSHNFSARGYGEEKELVPNDTPENRQRNRRVEVLISILRER